MIRRSRMYTGGLHDQKEQNVYRGLHDQKEQNVYSGASWSWGAECIQGGLMIRRSGMYTGGLHDQKKQNANRWQHVSEWLICYHVWKWNVSASVVGSVQMVLVRSDIVERWLLASSYLSVCPYVSAGLCLNGFLWYFVLGTLWKSVDKIEISLISNQNIGTLQKDLSASYCCRWQ